MWKVALVLTFGLFCFIGTVECREEWIACASNGGTCNADGDYVWARYGGGGSWNYRAVWNTTFPCSGSFFGTPVGTSDYSCYFLKSIDDVLLLYAANENENYITFVNSTAPANSIYIGESFYGDNQNKEYYIINAIGYLSCSSSQFGAEPPASGSRYCFTTPFAHLHSEEECAFDSQPCRVPDASAIYPLLYTGYSTDNYYTTLLRYASSSQEYSCSKSALFSGYYPPQSSNNICYFDTTNMIQFAVPSGAWKQVESCEGNITCSYELMYGVTSTTSQATTSTWSASLSDTIEEDLFFEKDSLTTTVSTSVSNTISSAYSQTASKSCSASCTVYNGGTVFLWQWQVITEEVNYENPASVLEPFTTFACNYLCTNSTEAPKCPPGYCADALCQTCTTNIFNTEKKETRRTNPLVARKAVREALKPVYEKYGGHGPILVVDENVEPSRRRKLIEEEGFIPLESLNLPSFVLDQWPRSKIVSSN